MATGTRNVRIHLSQQCFDLLVDGMATHSKRTCRFETLRMTVQAACESLKSREITKEELNRFLAEYAVEGDIAVWLEVTPKWSDAYGALRQKVKQLHDRHGLDKIVIPFAVYLAEACNPL